MRITMIWVHYMDTVDILRRFLKAGWTTGNWRWHLQSIHEKLWYLAASSHTLYAKSAYIYLQMMFDLPNSQPNIQKKFEEGYQFCAAKWQEYQILMKLCRSLVVPHLIPVTSTRIFLPQGKQETVMIPLIYFKDRDPFVQNPSLFNIANGMTAQDGVNVETAKAIGEDILTSMLGKSVEEFTF